MVATRRAKAAATAQAFSTLDVECLSGIASFGGRRELWGLAVILGARRARALPRASGRVVAAALRETVGAAGGSRGRADDPRERLPPLRVRGPADGDDGWRRRLRYCLRTPPPRSPLV